MLPSDCIEKNYIEYDIAEINSLDKTHADTQSNVMSIGRNNHGIDARVLIKFNFRHLPEAAQIENAILTIFVTKGSTLQLLGYSLNNNWDIHSINWFNQPSFDYTDKIFEKSIFGCDKYSINLTKQVRKWFECPYENYGMVLLSSNMSGLNCIQICTDQRSDHNLSLSVEYCVEHEIHVVPQFYEYMEDIEVSCNSEYFTTGFNISLMKLVSYFIKNNSALPIIVIAENSPDNLNYAKEIQTITIPPGASSLLVPINFSKYVRLSITVPPSCNTATINIWLNLQQ